LGRHDTTHNSTAHDTFDPKVVWHVVLCVREIFIFSLFLSIAALLLIASQRSSSIDGQLEDLVVSNVTGAIAGMWESREIEGVTAAVRDAVARLCRSTASGSEAEWQLPGQVATTANK
jgi:hypothetical protein